MAKWENLGAARLLSPKIGICGDVQPVFPRRVCNLAKGHAGEHCNSMQVGDFVARVYWPRDGKVVLR